MAKVIMIQGTMSGAGKSLLVAGLCRIFKQDGYRVAPFKSQNMALNSFVTREGLEMGRAQVVQAEAAGIEPMVCMNPILLKPTSDMGSQVIVNGEVLGNMRAREYFAYKTKLIPDIMKAYEALAQAVDIIVVEGAGSPAEINLKQNDIVNMGLAQMLDAPVLLVGDIDRGGVFAQLLGTLMLLEPEELQRVKGLVINKFRGDQSILDPGIDMLIERGNVPVCGVVPYMDVAIEDEDSLTEKFDSGRRRISGAKGHNESAFDAVDIAVIRYPRISNFTDFDVFDAVGGANVRYVTSVQSLGKPDLIFLPGSKNTMGDLKWLRESGLEACVKRAAERGTPVIGICGGYQMLGYNIADPDGVESGGQMRGLELLPIETVLAGEKTRKQVIGRFPEEFAGDGSAGSGGVCTSGGETFAGDAVFRCLAGAHYEGYEIHMGKSTTDWAVRGNVYGSYVHGLFDHGALAETLVDALAKRKGILLPSDGEIGGSGLDSGEYFGTGRRRMDYKAFKEAQYDKLAQTLREHLDMDYIYEVMGIDRG